MKRDVVFSAMIAAVIVLIMAFVVSEFDAFRDVGVWWFAVAGELNGSIHSPNALTLAIVAFVPSFVIVYVARRALNLIVKR